MNYEERKMTEQHKLLPVWIQHIFDFNIVYILFLTLLAVLRGLCK